MRIPVVDTHAVALMPCTPAKARHLFKISLHTYRTNKRLTQKTKVKDCRVLTWVAFRSWLVTKEQKKVKGNGVRAHPKPPRKEGLFPPHG